MVVQGKDCESCDIASGRVAASVVYKDDILMAIMGASPINTGPRLAKVAIRLHGRLG
ncbi:MAG: hypothetical protein V3U52_06230 [Thermoplasmata archaeon]